jgi:uncharacterized OB-fold protein
MAMEVVMSNVEPMVYKSGINVPYDWWAGETASRFFASLRDEQKILGTRCGACRKVFVPPRKTCPQCFAEAMSWEEVGPEGEVLTFTVARKQLAALPKKVPVVFGLIKLDAADTGLLHMLGDVAPEHLRVGMRVRAVFSETRAGNIMDIAYFAPTGKA